MFEESGALISAKIVKQEKKGNSGERIGQFNVFLRERERKNTEMDGGKKMWLLFLLHSFLHQEFSEVLAGSFYGVYLLYLGKDRLY